MDPVNSNMDNDIDGLLVKYLLGETGDAERRQVEAWMGQEDANRRYFEHFRMIWERSLELKPTLDADENKAWARFKERVGQEASRQETAGPATRVMKFPERKTSYIRVAALLVMLIGAGWLAWFLSAGGQGHMIALSSGDTTLTRTLPDGSVITLNKRSELSYPEHFSGNERLVRLKGEAFFDVAHDKSHPFIIHANDVSVKVVGTSFNIKAGKEKTEVIVATGIVEVSKNRYAVELRPNEKAVVRKSDARPVKEINSDELYNFYKTRELVCNGTPLWRVVEVLNEAYGAHITFDDPSIRTLSLSTTFHDESLDNILAVISETFNITVEKTGDRIILK